MAQPERNDYSRHAMVLSAIPFSLAFFDSMSSLMKLLHPGGACTKAEMQEYLSFALELRRRVKEQLKRMGGIEYSKVNLSFIDKENGEETFITCKELGSTQIIPDTPLDPGDLFTVGFDPEQSRYSLYRLQITATPGANRFSVISTSGRRIKESARMAYNYLKANARRIGIDRDISAYDINAQVISLMQSKDANDLGGSFFIGLISAILGCRTGGGMVVLGQMSLHGVLSRVEGLGDKLHIAMDSGARRVLIPPRTAAILPTCPPM